jgi:L-lactate dehydrogenase complex protein LldG
MMANDTNRETFLRTVRQALSIPTSHGRGEIEYGDIPIPAVRTASATALEVLAENAAALNIELALVADEAGAAAEIRTIVARTEPEWDHQQAVMAWDDPLLDAIGWEAALQDSGLELFRGPSPQQKHIGADQREAFYCQLRETRIGITTADYCVADTATLVLRNRAGQPGAVSLVPSVHVAVIRERQLLPDFIALYERLEVERHDDPEALTSRMTFISGPSKTGDIELVIVHGAHGPRALHLIVIRDSVNNLT